MVTSTKTNLNALSSNKFIGDERNNYNVDIGHRVGKPHKSITYLNMSPVTNEDGTPARTEQVLEKYIEILVSDYENPDREPKIPSSNPAFPCIKQVVPKVMSKQWTTEYAAKVVMNSLVDDMAIGLR